MRNTILKSYAKKILKSEAFVSVIIVFVLALGIIGSSYALYMDVDTDTNYQLVEVGDLSIGFDNGSNLITLENMTPTSDEIATGTSDSEIARDISSKNLFSFYIYNTGSYTANYEIKLIAETGNEVETKYINYQICRDNSDNCKDINTLNETGETTIYRDELTPNSTAVNVNSTNPSAYYFLRLWINDKYTETASSKTIKLKVLIEAKNASGLLDTNNTLAGRILSDENITINNTEPIFNDIANYKVKGDSTSGEPGLYKAEDDYGISYYFRGAQSHNYVNFAGFTWRIVRINGDGSIRLILDGTLNKIEECDDSNSTIKFCSISSFNSVKTDNGYIGYMHGEFTSNSTNYNEAHSNIYDSTIKEKIDAFYETHLVDNEEYIADTLFCGDKTRANNYTTLGYGTERTYYGSYDRLYKTTPLTPTLKCATGDDLLTEEQKAYSRYTAGEKAGRNRFDMSTETSKGVLINNDLKYPIALLSTDELVMAGAYKTEVANPSYYLSDAYYYDMPTLHRIWWTLNPNNYGNGYCSYVDGSSIYVCNIVSSYGIRPVINLKADILVDKGDGTKTYTYDSEGNILTGPYTVKLN